MPFVPLHELLPDVAEAETRSITLLDEDGDSLGSDFFFEMFCDEPGCDCRRVFIHVASDDPSESQPRAALAWGWEPDEFYRR
ncbi:MAG TPA: hypothetical protein RMH99_05840 [Sandaracinaceae bacterium LLY-WYZ-13_1]|nr:hypothetical protein [Sandaracinaceae bacterium LLY-WYZ-13_1]